MFQDSSSIHWYPKALFESWLAKQFSILLHLQLLCRPTIQNIKDVSKVLSHSTTSLLVAIAKYIKRGKLLQIKCLFINVLHNLQKKRNFYTFSQWWPETCSLQCKSDSRWFSLWDRGECKNLFTNGFSNILISCFLSFYFRYLH